MCRDVSRPGPLVLVLCLCALLSREPAAGQGAELRPGCPPREGRRCQEGEFSASGESTYKVDGHSVYVNYMVGSHFDMHCDSASRSAEHPALPRFTELVRVRSVTLRACAPPALSYARVLAALNVSVSEALVLRDLPAPAPPLRDDHFAGLGSLLRLELHGALSESPAALLPRAALAPLPALRNLTLTNVRPGGALEPLPVGLRSLRLWFTGVKYVALGGAASLQQFSLREKSAAFVNVTGAATLESVLLSSPNSSVAGATRLGSLRVLGIDYWSETRPEPWAECDALEELRLMDSVPPGPTRLPAGWVARCPVLSALSLRRVVLAPLPPGLLGNTTSLKTLMLSGCHLAQLPKDLFNDSVQLKSLDLSYNRLETLSRDLFFSLRGLKTLNLSNNLLTAGVVPALQPLSTLMELLLADNTRLLDLCDGGTNTITTMVGPSQLQQMTDLRKLVLRNTGVSRVCRDWREAMPRLKELDLSETNVTVLKYADVMQRRSEPGAIMRVGGRNYTVRFEYSREDYERARADPPAPGDLLLTLVHASVLCDCSAYWAALVFREGPRHTRLRAPPCAHTHPGTGREDTLRNVSLDSLTCAAPQLCGAGLRGCQCVSRDDREWTGGVATARCERLGLTTVPRLPPAGPAWRLLLANNSIATVRAGDLPPHLHELDLRHNLLEEVDDSAATALLARRVRLAGNPLRCDCEAAGLLRELAARPDRVDLENVTCADGSAPPTPEWLAAECAPAGVPMGASTVAALLVLLALAALALGTVLARPEMRLRAKILFERAGWRSAGREGGGAGDGRLFDVFVSYAHEDEEWVRGTLVARLEGGAAPLRVCVHYRDWAPGEWIPAQIAASVRASRRTLAVVSRHFLKSDWARLEFREAHAQARRDVTPRLVVLLLEEPALLPLDAEMRAFIENNTYVRWGDPWFWKKLEHAMPAGPRTPAHAHTPAHATR